MPRAHHMPVRFAIAMHPVPATTNPLGVKGKGEAGTTGSLAAIMNAVADAIPGGAGAALDMPATPAKVRGRVPEERRGLIKRGASSWRRGRCVGRTLLNCHCEQGEAISRIQAEIALEGLRPPRSRRV